VRTTFFTRLPFLPFGSHRNLKFFKHLEQLVLGSWIATQGSVSTFRQRGPALRLGVLAKDLQGVGVREEKRNRVRKNLLRVELGNLKFRQGKVVLSLIQAGTGHSNRKINAHAWKQVCAIHRPAQFKCTVRTTETPLTVDHKG
jgi:hypothetical protein